MVSAVKNRYNISNIKVKIPECKKYFEWEEFKL